MGKNKNKKKKSKTAQTAAESKSNGTNPIRFEGDKIHFDPRIGVLEGHTTEVKKALTKSLRNDVIIQCSSAQLLMQNIQETLSAVEIIDMGEPYGNGIRATKNINKNTFILPYTGIFSIVSNENLNNANLGVKDGIYNRLLKLENNKNLALYVHTANATSHLVQHAPERPQEHWVILDEANDSESKQDHPEIASANLAFKFIKLCNDNGNAFYIPAYCLNKNLEEGDHLFDDYGIPYWKAFNIYPTPFTVKGQVISHARKYKPSLRLDNIVLDINDITEERFTMIKKNGIFYYSKNTNEAYIVFFDQIARHNILNYLDLSKNKEYGLTLTTGYMSVTFSRRAFELNIATIKESQNTILLLPGVFENASAAGIRTTDSDSSDNSNKEDNIDVSDTNFSDLDDNIAHKPASFGYMDDERTDKIRTFLYIPTQPNYKLFMHFMHYYGYYIDKNDSFTSDINLSSFLTQFSNINGESKQQDELIAMRFGNNDRHILNFKNTFNEQELIISVIKAAGIKCSFYKDTDLHLFSADDAKIDFFKKMLKAIFPIINKLNINTGVKWQFQKYIARNNEEVFMVKYPKPTVSAESEESKKYEVIKSCHTQIKEFKPQNKNPYIYINAGTLNELINIINSLFSVTMTLSSSLAHTLFAANNDDNKDEGQNVRDAEETQPISFGN